MEISTMNVQLDCFRLNSSDNLHFFARQHRGTVTRYCCRLSVSRSHAGIMLKWY